MSALDKRESTCDEGGPCHVPEFRYFNPTEGKPVRGEEGIHEPG